MGQLDQLENGPMRQAAKWLVHVAQAAGFRFTITSVRRSRATQQRLYNAYKAGRSRFPAAPPGTSKHERGLAFDLGGLSDAQLRALGEVWESIGGRWGGRFKDPIHFEAP